MSHVDAGIGLELGPVEEAVKRLLVLLGLQRAAEWCPPLAFEFHNMAVRSNCPAHEFLLCG